MTIPERTEQISSDLRWLSKENRTNWCDKPYISVDSVEFHNITSWMRHAPKDFLLQVLRQRFSKATYSDELNSAIEKLATDMLAPFGVLGFWKEGQP